MCNLYYLYKESEDETGLGRMSGSYSIIILGANPSYEQTKLPHAENSRVLLIMGIEKTGNEAGTREFSLPVRQNQRKDSPCHNS